MNPPNIQKDLRTPTTTQCVFQNASRTKEKTYSVWSAIITCVLFQWALLCVFTIGENIVSLNWGLGMFFGGSLVFGLPMSILDERKEMNDEHIEKQKQEKNFANAIDDAVSALCEGVQEIAPFDPIQTPTQYLRPTQNK